MYPYIHIFSKTVPSYGIMLMTGIWVAGFLSMLRIRRAGLRWENGMAVLACALGTAMLGAICLYIGVTYSLSDMINMVKSGSLFTGSKLGMVFYGGLLGAIPGVLLGIRITHIRASEYILPMVPCIPLGHAFGRIGCLLAGCCYGVPTDLPIGIIYPYSLSGVPTGIRLFPVQIVEALSLFAIFCILSIYSRHSPDPKRVVSLYLILYSICRFVLEEYRYDSIRGFWGALSTSQWISALLFVIGIILWLPASNPCADLQFRSKSQK